MFGNILLLGKNCTIITYNAKVNKSTHLELYFQTKLNINYNVCNHLTIIYVQRTLLPHLGFFWLAIAKTGYQWPQTILEYIWCTLQQHLIYASSYIVRFTSTIYGQRYSRNQFFGICVPISFVANHHFPYSFKYE